VLIYLKQVCHVKSFNDEFIANVVMLVCKVDTT
jgi:hypothetical protein